MARYILRILTIDFFRVSEDQSCVVLVVPVSF